MRVVEEVLKELLTPKYRGHPVTRQMIVDIYNDIVQVCLTLSNAGRIGHMSEPEIELLVMDVFSDMGLVSARRSE
jgi:hypothetical protein